MTSKPAIQKQTTPPIRNARASRRKAVDQPEPDVAERSEALQVRIDDERHDDDRRQRPRQRRELAQRDCEHDQTGGAEQQDVARSKEARRQLASSGARVRGVELGVDQTVQRHRQRAGAGHRDRDPDQIAERGSPVNCQDRADVRVRQREDRVLELDERGEPPWEGRGRRTHRASCRG